MENIIRLREEMEKTQEKIKTLKKGIRISKFIKKAGKDFFDIENIISSAQYEALPLLDCPDGGASNFDSVQIDLTGRNWKFIEALEEFSGLTFNKVYKNNYIVGYRLTGQGNRRTAQARAISEFLNKNGIKASVYYAMD